MALIESGVDLSPITVPLFKLELTVYWRVLKRGADAPLKYPRIISLEQGESKRDTAVSRRPGGSPQALPLGALAPLVYSYGV